MKLLRDVSGAEAVRALKRLDFVVGHQKGSHLRLNKASVHVTVPNHKTILPKTLQTMLKQAGVSPEEFMAAL